LEGRGDWVLVEGGRVLDKEEAEGEGGGVGAGGEAERVGRRVERKGVWWEGEKAVDEGV